MVTDTLGLTTPGEEDQTTLIALLLVLGSSGKKEGNTESPGISITEGTTTLSENGGTGSYHIVLNTKPDGDVSIDVASPDPDEVKVSSDGGATEATSLNILFSTENWDIAQTVTLVGQDDDIVDGNQTVSIENTINLVSTTDSTGYGSLDPEDVTAEITDEVSSGEKYAYSLDSIDMNLVFVSPKSFPTGLTDSGSSSVVSAIAIGETEVTYELWNAVYTWATTDAGGGTRADGGVLYYFANSGQQGASGNIACTTINHVGNSQHPVECIN